MPTDKKTPFSSTRKKRLGFFALTRIDDPSSSGIHPHEKTHKEPLEDRIQVMHACQANLSSIFALYSQPKQTITQLLEEHVRGIPPTIQVKDEGKGSNLLWEITDNEIIGSIQRQMEDQPLLIADGHLYLLTEKGKLKNLNPFQLNEKHMELLTENQ